MRTRYRALLLLLASRWLTALSGCDVYDPSLLGDGPNGRVNHAKPTCGNAQLDDGESCDTSIAQGQRGACPRECSSADPCIRSVLAGSECSARCLEVQIEKSINHDGCCPKGAGPSDDSDCESCGDGIVGPTETCDPPAACVNERDCFTPSACLIAVFSGRPESCSARCELRIIEQCVGGDGCCPAACDPTSDSDCSQACGNGIVEPEKGETCEDGSQSPCPGSCDDSIGCTADLMTGSRRNCNVTCTHQAIQTPHDGDLCCPQGANALNDSDCDPICGNHVVEGDELCDPCPADCSDENACTTDTRSGTGCSITCGHTAITAAANGDGCCPAGADSRSDDDCPGVCGNGVTEAGEECDGGGRCNANCKLVLPSSLVHRYNFDGSGTTVVDSVGTANGTVVNTTLSGQGSVLLDGTNTRFVDFPNGLLSSWTDVTVELWLTWHGGPSLQRILDFGMNSGGEGSSSGSKTSALDVLPSNSANHFAAYIDFTASTVDGDETTLKDDTALAVDVMTHVAVTFQDSTNTFSLYRDGVRIDRNTTVTGHLSSIDDRNVWIGKANASGIPTLNATIYELRIYNAALSDSALAASASAGPDP